MFIKDILRVRPRIGLQSRVYLHEMIGIAILLLQSLMMVASYV